MDPTALISSAPAEWMPALIILALLVKAFQYWVNRKQQNNAVDEIHKEPDVRG